MFSMDFYFIIYLNVLPLTLPGLMHLIFIGRLTGKAWKYWHVVLYLTLLNLMNLLFSILSVPTIPSIGAELLMLYAVNRFLSNNPPKVSFAASTLALYITQLSFGMMNALEAIILPYFFGKPLFYLLLILSTLASCGLCICCYGLLLKSLSLKEEQDTLYLELLLFPVLFFFAAELYILQTAYSTAPAFFTDSFAYTGKHLILLSLQALGLGALLCTQYAYRRTCQSFQTQAMLASLTQAAQAQKTYIAEAQLRDEQTRAFRHDIKNHLSVLGGLLNTQNLDAAKSYLQKLEAVSASLSFPYHTGNPTVDILLGEKLELAKTRGISTDLSLHLPKNSILDDFDLCIIFSNALDNAIHACLSLDADACLSLEREVCLSLKSEDRLPPDRNSCPPTDKKQASQNLQQPFIHILGEQQGDFYRLEFKNTCSAAPLPPMGTGLSNIQAVALKYHGAMQIEKKGQDFCLHVLLNMRCS